MEEPKKTFPIENIGLKQLREMREETTKRWEKLGLLEGLDGNVKEDCAKLFEGKLSYFIMEHLFVPFEICLTLREKGFDEPCRDHWERGQNDKEWELFTSGEWLTKKDLMADYKDANGNLCGEISAPLYQQVLDWLREKHKIYIELIIDGWENDEKITDEYIGYRAFVWKVSEPKPHHNDDLGMSDYYTILKVAIEHALKLI